MSEQTARKILEESKLSVDELNLLERALKEMNIELKNIEAQILRDTVDAGAEKISENPNRNKPTNSERHR